MGVGVGVFVCVGVFVYDIFDIFICKVFYGICFFDGKDRTGYLLCSSISSVNAKLVTKTRISYSSFGRVFTP